MAAIKDPENTLVIETTNFSEQGHFRGAWENLKITERLSRKDARTINYRFTVEDAAIYAGPWSAEFVLTRSRERIYEYSCHEHNYSMVNILQAGRVADAKAAAKAAKAMPKRR